MLSNFICNIIFKEQSYLENLDFFKNSWNKYKMNTFPMLLLFIWCFSCSFLPFLNFWGWLQALFRKPESKWPIDFAKWPESWFLSLIFNFHDSFSKKLLPLFFQTFLYTSCYILSTRKTILRFAVIGFSILLLKM